MPVAERRIVAVRIDLAGKREGRQQHRRQRGFVRVVGRAPRLVGLADLGGGGERALDVLRGRYIRRRDRGGGKRKRERNEQM